MPFITVIISIGYNPGVILTQGKEGSFCPNFYNNFDDLQ